MGLKTPQDYVQSLRDGRVTYWDGEDIADITTHPRFKVPIAITAADYDYAVGRVRRVAPLQHRGRQRGPPHLPDPAQRGRPRQPHRD